MNEETDDTDDATIIGMAPIPQPRPAPTIGHPAPSSVSGSMVARATPVSSVVVAPALAHPPVASQVRAPVAPLATPGYWAPTTVDGPRPDDADPLIGQELCGYTIRRRLAEGGMGVVYAGDHAKIGRAAAIKVLKLELCRSEEAVERFHQEARAVNSIRHANIVDIYDFGRDPHGRVFFVMEYLEGEPLSSRLRRGPLSWPEALPILEQTLRALKAAHDKGFVHRDLKPDNIWLRNVEGRVQVKLLDFGIAKLVGAETPKEKLTQTGSVIGTPHYMSPEQINGSRAIDHRTDIYALGIITYELFAGVTPFVGDTLQAVMTGHLFREPPRLADLPAHLCVPPAIAEIVDRMLVKDANGRYASVPDVLADLHDVSRNAWPTHAESLRRTWPTRVPAPIATPTGASRSGRTRGIVFAGVLAAAVVAIAGVAIWQRSPEPPAAQALATPPTTPIAPDRGPTNPLPAPAIQVVDHAALRAEAQTLLRASLRETEPAVRVQGADALGRIKDLPSVPPLTELTENDADAEVRGHAAEALGTIAAASAGGARRVPAGAPPPPAGRGAEPVAATAPLLGKLETAAPPPLKVWYASALARLGDRGAVKRLVGYARAKDLAVAFKAALTLAEISPPGDRKAIAALRALAAHEAELTGIAPYAGALILTRLAALHDIAARKLLYELLESRDEGARLAAAEGLAKLGDDAGKPVLHEVFANQASPNRLVAAAAQIPLGEYGGLALFTQSLAAREPATRRLAARALGDIGEPGSLTALLALANDKDWTVRIAAAAAVVAIVGLDPQVLAQASVDWTRGALESEDWAVRNAAAGVLADIPENQAMPLLARAIADPDPKVRLAASRSAGKMKTADAVAKVVVAVKTETDPGVKEQQVKALGQIGNATARDTLAKISEEPGRIGVFAAGSLIAVGDVAGKVRLEAAMADPVVDLRLAAVQAASTAKNPIVVPMLKIGLLDLVFAVRFAAAEGLSVFNAEKAAAVPVLTAALESKDAGVVARAVAALTRLGEKLRDSLQTPADMVGSTDPKQRLAAVPIVRALPIAEKLALLRRLVADPDQDVRRAGVDAIEEVATRDKGQAIRLYRPLVDDADPVVRSKAAGQLARLVDPPRPPPPAPAPPRAAPPAARPDPPPAVDDALPKVKLAFDAATAAAGEARAAAATFEALARELATTTAAPAHDDTTVSHVADLANRLGEAAEKLETSATTAEAAAQAASDAAGDKPSPDATKLVADARGLARDARSAAGAARARVADAADRARKYVKDETRDVQVLIAVAETAIAANDFSEAKHKLDQAARLLRKSGARNAGLDALYARLYERIAAHTRDPAAKRKLLQQEQLSYRHLAKIGVGPEVQRANERLAEIAEELKELGPP